METNHTMINTKDGNKLFVIKWSSDEKPKAVIQIAHGMAEHIKRYGDFANSLVEAGFLVYGSDHRGHGKTAGSLDKVGYFADENGWDIVVDDMYTVTKFIKEQNQGLPVYYLGHSMGSLLLRDYISKYGSELKGAIISGTAGNPGFLGKIALLIARIEGFFQGKKNRSILLTNLTFGGFNKSYKPKRTDFDWLSRDNKEVDKYINDPFCGGVFTNGFYCDLFEGVMKISNIDNIKNTPDDLEMLFFSGAEDPAGNFSKGVQFVIDMYKELGIRDLSFKFYKDARHETLNEINKQDVYNDVISWLNERC